MATDTKVIGKRDSIVVLGLSFTDLSPRDVAELTDTGIGTVWKIKQKYDPVIKDIKKRGIKEAMADISYCVENGIKINELDDIDNEGLECLDLSKKDIGLWTDKYYGLLMKRK